jgi:ABC-type antimicrobial peptide transport system ATPase subunit
MVNAVDNVDLRIAPGTTLGLVGESGSGKSTLARLVTRLIEPTKGNVVLNGTDITALRGPKLRRERQGMQMVFQDPYSSLDPRQSILEVVGEPLRIHTSMNSSERRTRVIELLGQVGIGPHVLSRQPHEFSGGQRQRVAIARALALEPARGERLRPRPDTRHGTHLAGGANAHKVCSFTFTEAYFCRSASRVAGVTPVSSCGAMPFREAANESGIG